MKRILLLVSLCLATFTGQAQTRDGGISDKMLREMEKEQKLTPADKTKIPQLACSMAELSKRQDINPRAGFLLSLIDGATSVSDLIDLSMTPEDETMALLSELYQQNVITLK